MVLDSASSDDPMSFVQPRAALAAKDDPAGVEQALERGDVREHADDDHGPLEDAEQLAMTIPKSANIAQPSATAPLSAMPSRMKNSA